MDLLKLFRVKSLNFPRQLLFTPSLIFLLPSFRSTSHIFLRIRKIQFPTVRRPEFLPLAIKYSCDPRPLIISWWLLVVGSTSRNSKFKAVDLSRTIRDRFPVFDMGHKF